MFRSGCTSQRPLYGAERPTVKNKLYGQRWLALVRASKSDCEKSECCPVVHEGRRCIGLARTATENASIERQVEVLREFATKKGMIYVGDVCLIGVSGSHTEKHIDDLIKRKVENDDFEVLLAADRSRLTRRGSAHGERLLKRLRRAGIEVAFIGSRGLRQRNR